MSYTSREAYEFAFAQINDPIIQRKTCSISGEEFPITQQDMEFYNKITPTFGTTPFPFVLPTLCPEERHRRRIARRNMRKFHKGVCALTGKSIVSLYSGQKPYTVYHQDVRWSDARDPMSYAKEYDFSRPFFPQYEEQMLAVPRMAMVNSKTENCEYANYIKDAKNCYMSSVLYFGCENVLYSTRIMSGSMVADSYELRGGELCYECTSSTKLYKCVFAHECFESQNIWFSANLINCSDCYYCYNLSNKKYCIHNIQYSKEEYLTKITDIKAQQDFWERSQEIFGTILITRPLRATRSINCENSIGSNIFNGKDAVFVFGGQHYNNVKYVLNSEGGEDNMDMTGGMCSLVYESTNVGLEGTMFVVGSTSVLNSHHMYYCDNCYSCSYCFGCIGLRNKSYCILNAQYSKENREQHMARIAKHMTETQERGQFLPLKDNTFAYNETYAHDLFPLTKDEVIQRGLSRYEEQKSPYEGIVYVPESLDYYDPQIVGMEASILHRKELLSGIIKCPVSGRGFKIIGTELDLCLKLQIPLPTIHPDERYSKRYTRMSGKILYLRNCSKTGKEILSVYDADTPNPVWSEEVRDEGVY